MLDVNLGPALRLSQAAAPHTPRQAPVPSCTWAAPKEADTARCACRVDKDGLSFEVISASTPLGRRDRRLKVVSIWWRRFAVRPGND
jgi:hypothetical protein